MLDKLLAILDEMSQHSTNTLFSPLKALIAVCKHEVTKTINYIQQTPTSYSSSEAYLYITTLLLLHTILDSTSDESLNLEDTKSLNRALNIIKQVINGTLKDCYTYALTNGDSWAAILSISQLAASEEHRPSSNNTQQELFQFLYQGDILTNTKRCLLSGLIFGKPILPLLLKDFFANHAHIPIPYGVSASDIILSTPVHSWPSWLSSNLTQDETNILTTFARLHQGKTVTLRLIEEANMIFSESNRLRNDLLRR